MKRQSSLNYVDYMQMIRWSYCLMIGKSFLIAPSKFVQGIFRSVRFFEVHCHDGIQLYKRVLGMLLEPFYTESNWTTKNQVLAYQKKLFVNADTHREILLSQNLILCKCCILLILYFWKFDGQVHLYISLCNPV